jgi:Ca2+-binding RTX toxin-like protein
LKNHVFSCFYGRQYFSFLGILIMRFSQNRTDGSPFETAFSNATAVVGAATRKWFEIETSDAQGAENSTIRFFVSEVIYDDVTGDPIGGIVKKLVLKQGGATVATFSGFSATTAELDALIDPLLLTGDASAFQAWFQSELTLFVASKSGPGVTNEIGDFANAVKFLGTNSDDIFLAGGFDDNLIARGGNDSITAQGGNDRVVGGAGLDTIDGGDGDDRLIGGKDADVIAGGAGQDTIIGGSGADTLEGGSGDDNINGNGGNDLISSSDGNNTLSGGGGDDTITGGSGVENISGGAGDDVLFAGAGDASQIDGGAGHDSLTASDAVSQELRGGSGNDTINGGLSDDYLLGGDGSDVINGNGGNDRISGGTGQDTLNGGSGADTLYGDGGLDILSGGEGDDIFVFRLGDSGKGAFADVITDFTVFGEADLIYLTGLQLQGGFIGAETFSGSELITGGGQVRVTDDGVDSLVLVDVFGDGIADFAIKVEGFVGLIDSDFLLN